MKLTLTGEMLIKKLEQKWQLENKTDCLQGDCLFSIRISKKSVWRTEGERELYYTYHINFSV